MTTTTDKDVAPAVWVGCLACYNDGALNGRWMGPADAVDWACKRTDTLYPHEETWCFDHQGFDGLISGECSPVQARRVAELIDDAESRGIDTELMRVYVSDTGVALDSNILDELEGAALYDSAEDYAYHLAECIEGIPDYLEGYIDWARYGQDVLDDHGSYYETSEGIWVL